MTAPFQWSFGGSVVVYAASRSRNPGVLVRLTAAPYYHRARILLPARDLPRESRAMHTNQPKPVRVRAGNVLGSIETQPNGDQVLCNAQNEVRGYYDAEGDVTRDADKNIVAKGNKLRSMIC